MIGHSRVGMFGTFDAGGLGEGLVPRIVEKELTQRLGDIELRVFTPFGSMHPPLLHGAIACEAIGARRAERVERLAAELDLVLIGSGDLIHAREEMLYPASFRADGEHLRSIRATRWFLEALGDLQDPPAIWNAVGVPFDLTPQESAIVRETASTLPYLAVRNEISRSRLEEAGIERDVAVVPDPAILVPRLFDSRTMEKALDYLRVMGWYPEEGSTLLLQGGSGLLRSVWDVAAAVERIRRTLDLKVVLVEAQPGDRQFTHAMSRVAPGRIYRVPGTVGLEHVTAAIAAADVLIGDSWQAHLAAAAFGRRRVWVTPDGKNASPSTLPGDNSAVVTGADEIPQAVERLFARREPGRGFEAADAAVDQHFDRIAEVFEKGAASSPGQNKLVQASELSRLYRRTMHERDQELQEQHRSTYARAWYLREALRTFYEQVPAPSAVSLRARIRRWVGVRVAPWGTRRGVVLRRALGRRTGPRLEAVPRRERYALWLKLHVTSASRLRRIRREVHKFAYRPLISILMPTFNTRADWLRTAVRSLRRQVYPYWELCIADDSSTDPRTRRALRWARWRNHRVRVRFLDTNGGISWASNAALRMAEGEFVGLMDHDDELKPGSLFDVVKLLNEKPDLDFIYTDEDKKAADGGLLEPFFKPSWSPNLLLSANYITHLAVFRRSLLTDVGGFRSEYDGSQDYDLILRVTEATKRIAHAPMPGYTWRQVEGSAAGSVVAKPFAYESAKRALRDALGRRGIRAEVQDGLLWGYYRVKYPVNRDTSVTLICLPSSRQGTATSESLDEIRHRSSYPELEVLAPTREAGESWAAAAHRAAAAAKGDVMLFLDAGLRPLDPYWIEAMLEHAQRPGVGAVGARLLGSDGRPVHEGVAVFADGTHRNIVARYYFVLTHCIRDTSAVTGACIMTNRKTFESLRGFDESLSEESVGVDYCLRARSKGYDVLYTPYAVLEYEGARTTQGRGEDEVFRERWSGYHDPFYSVPAALLLPSEDRYDSADDESPAPSDSGMSPPATTRS